MKTRIRTYFFFIALASAALLAAPSAQAVTKTWIGTDGEWDTATNWSATGVPASGDTALFNINSNLAVSLDGANRSITSINFDTGAGSFTISASAAESLLLQSGGNISILSTLSTTGLTETINAPISLGGNYTFTNAKTGAGSSLVIGGNITNTATSLLTLSGAGTGGNTISGNISDGAGATVQSVSMTATAGSWTLSGSNSYSGTTTISGAGGTLITSGTNTSAGATTLTAGTLRLDSVSNGGLAPGTLALSGGTLQSILASSTLSNVVSLTAGSTVSGSQSITFNGALTQTASSTLTSSITGGNALTLAGNVNIDSGSATPLTLTIAGTGNTVISGTIQDWSGGVGTSHGNLSISNTGTTTLSAANTYGGTTTISGGTVEISGSGTLGATTALLTMSGGLLDLGATTQTVGAVSITVAPSSGNTIQNGILSGSSYAASNTSGTATVTAVLSGSGINLTKSGAGGTLVLTGSNTYTGLTTVTGSGSTLVLSGLNDSSGIAVADHSILRLVANSGNTMSGTSTVFGSGTLQSGSSNNAAPIFQLRSDSSVTFAMPNIIGGSATGNFGFDVNNVAGVNGSGPQGNTLTIIGTYAPGGSGNDHGQTTTVTGGNGYILSLGTVLAEGATTNVNTFNVASGLGLNIATLTQLNNGKGHAILVFSGSGTTTIALMTSIAGTQFNTTISSGILNLTGSNNLSTSAAPTITMTGGTLNLGNAGALNDSIGTPADLIQSGGGTIDNTGTGGSAYTTLGQNITQNWNGNFTFVGSNSLNMGTGAVTIGAASTVTVNANTLKVGGVISGGSSFGLTKAGAGTLALSGSNNYTGATTINAGILLINGNSASAGGSVQVNGGGALGGIGTVGGAVTVVGGTTSATQGTINLQDGVIGTLTLNNGITIGSGGNNSNLMFDLAGTSLTSDTLAITGGITMSGTGVISVDDLSATALQTGTYVLITSSSGLGANFTLSSNTITVSGTTYSLSLASSTGSQELLTVSLSGSVAASGTAYWQGSQSANWNTLTGGVTSNFNTTINGGTNTAALPGAGTNVVFTTSSPVAGNLTTALGQDFTINSLEFNSSGTASVIIGGTNTLTINASGTNGNTAGNGITVDAGSAANTISSKVALGSSQTWTINGSPLTVSGNITDNGSSYSLTKSGTGTLIVSGSASYSGTTGVTAGILEVDGSLSGSSAVTVNAATLQGTGLVGGTVALTGSSTLASSGTLTLAQGFSVSGSANTLSNGTITGNATQNAASAFAVNGTLNGSDTLSAGASLSGTGSVGLTTLNGTDNLSSVGTLTVASLTVNNGGNTISSGTVDAIGGTTLNADSGLAVNGTLEGTVAIGSGATLSGTGTVTAGVTVGAGGVTSPGAGSAPGVMTTDLAYSGSSTANFNVASSGSAGTPQAQNSHLYYSQMIVTGTAGQVSLAIGNNVTLGATSTTSVAQTGSQIQGDGSSNSGVTLQLTLSSADYTTLLNNATTNYDAKAGNTSLDNYFVFNLGSTLSTGRFTTLDIDVTGGANVSGTIYYSGSSDRFAADGVGNTIGDVYIGGQEFALSYTGEYGSNSTIGGNDIVLTAIPEPGTWGMILGGFGMLMGFQRLRKRRIE